MARLKKITFFCTRILQREEVTRRGISEGVLLEEAAVGGRVAGDIRGKGLAEGACRVLLCRRKCLNRCGLGLAG